MPGLAEGGVGFEMADHAVASNKTGGQSLASAVSAHLSVFTTSSVFRQNTTEGFQESCNVARRRGLWVNLQSERAYWQRIDEQARRAAERREAKEARDRERARRDARRQAVADERERNRLYHEDCKAEAAAKTADLQIRIAELDSVLTAGLHEESGISFASFKRTVEIPRPRRPHQPAEAPTATTVIRAAAVHVLALCSCWEPWPQRDNACGHSARHQARDKNIVLLSSGL
jgi:hypothetical protein